MKETYYFSHDCNARNDVKILKLRRKLGMEGYGIYWSIIEMLREDENYTLQIKYIDEIAFSLSVKIDILHSDIQGFELQMLQDITKLLFQNRIKYLFISTHSNDLHYKCIKLLKECNYRIIASADFETDTFCYDGIIVACHINNQRFGNYNLGKRKFTKLINS
jgi:hypothetical protein